MFNFKKVRTNKHLAGIVRKKFTKKEIWSFINLALCVVIDIILLCGMNQTIGLKIGHYLNQDTFYVWPLLGAMYVQFSLGAWVYIGWYKEWFKNHSLGMDTLVGIGSIIPFLFSLVMAAFGWHAMLLNHINHWITNLSDGGNLIFPPIFSVGATVVLVITIGETINASFERKLSSKIKDLNEQKATNANLIVGQDIEVVAAKTLKINDLVLVKKAEIIPADGVLISTHAMIDDRNFTGEINYTEKAMGEELLGGSVNAGEALQMRITKLYKDSMINQLIKKVQKTQGAKLEINKTIDKVAGWFTPVVLVLAVMFFLIQFYCGASMYVHGLDLLLPAGVVWTTMNKASIAIYYAVGVLVGACPCVFGIAIPIVMAVGSAKFLRYNILLNKGKAFDAFKKIKAIAFDKTGTITEGVFKVNHIHGDEQYVSYMYALSSLSNHPISLSFVKHVKEENLDVEKIDIQSCQEIPGVGLSAQIAQDTYKIVSFQYVQTNNICSEFNLCPMTVPLVTFSYLLKNDKVVLEVSFIDRIKPDTYVAINELKAKGYYLYLITGDNEKNAQFLKEELGFNEVYAKVLPEQKQAIIQKIQETQEVIYIGDGLNDIAALQQANVSIAMNNGNNISKSVSDFIVLDNNLTSAINGIKVIRQALKTINLNLIWASIYNAIIIPLSGIGIIMPILSAVLMFCSDFTLCANGAVFSILPVRWKTDCNVLINSSELVDKFAEINHIENL